MPTSAVRLLDPVHDRRHVLDDESDSRESLIACGLKLPEVGVKLAVYTWVDASGRAGVSVNAYGPLAGPSGILERFDDVAVPAEMGFDDWRVGPLHLRQHDEPFAGVDFTVEAEQIQASCRFEALHEPYAYSVNGETCPRFLAHERFEQSGRVKGTITVRGESFEFDTVGHRDHSWGTRDWGVPQHWKWIEAQSEAGSAVHAFAINALGRSWLYGYVFKDGVLSNLVDADIRVVNNARLELQECHAVLTDDLGRSVRLDGETFASYSFQVHPLATCSEDSIRAEIDGELGVGQVEQLWPTAYADYVRTSPAALDLLVPAGRR